MPGPFPIAESGHYLELLRAAASRRGLITGATGTGKTVTPLMAGRFSATGVSVFMAHVKR